MSKRLRIAAKFSVLGVAVTGGLAAYSLLFPHSEINQVIGFGLCPPAILFMVFIDIRSTGMDLVVAWLIVASFNAVVYGVVAAAIWTLWKSD